MFILRFTNVTCSSDGNKFGTLDSAIEAGKKAGFEFSVWNGDSHAASWTVFGGLRKF